MEFPGDDNPQHNPSPDSDLGVSWGLLRDFSLHPISVVGGGAGFAGGCFSGVFWIIVVSAWGIAVKLSCRLSERLMVKRSCLGTSEWTWEGRSSKFGAEDVLY